MTIRFGRNLAAMAGVDDPMQASQTMGDLAGLQGLEAPRSQGAGLRAPMMDNLERPVMPSMEANRQLPGPTGNSEVAPLSGYSMPTVTQVAADPRQVMGGMEHMNTNRGGAVTQRELSNAANFAKTVGPPQAAQRMGDQVRAMESGYQQPDMTGVLADAQQATTPTDLMARQQSIAQDFSNEYRYALMNAEQKGTVEMAFNRLQQNPGVA